MNFEIFLVFFTILSQILAKDSLDSVLERDKLDFLQKLKEKMLDPYDQSLSQESYDYNIYWMNKTSDAFISNWIKNADYNVDRAEKNLKKHLEWRRKNNLDNILLWEAPEYLKNNFPYYFLGFNDDSNLVVYANFGEWDVRNAIALGYRRDYVKYVIKILESIHKTLEEDNIRRRSQPNGQGDGGQAVIIGNLEGFSFFQVSSIRVLGLVTDVMHIYETHYPLTHNKIFVVNAPGYFTIILDIIKNIISARSFEAIHVFARDQSKWLPEMEEFVPKNMIPEIVGGLSKIPLISNSIQDYK